MKRQITKGCWVNIATLLSAIFCTATNFAQVIPKEYPGIFTVNYVRSWTSKAPESDPAILKTKAVKDVTQSTTYFDGLGRLLQTVIKQGSLETASGVLSDLVRPLVYDEMGREQFKYLPFVANNTGGNNSVIDGNIKLNPFQQQAAFYNDPNGVLKGQGETFYYSQTNFEASPLNRALESFAPGNNWVGTSGQAIDSNRKSIKTKTWTNTIADSVRIWNVTDDSFGFGTYTTLAIYAAGQLYKTVITDEHNKQTIEFKDKEGSLVLKKAQLTASPDNRSGKNHTGWLCTYYIYDNLTHLRCVIQPGGVEVLASNGWDLNYSNGVLLKEQCFRYEYDNRERMIIKKIPGAGAIYMIYDARDRLVMTQDSLMRAGHQWLYTQYDEWNRIRATGLMIDNTYYNNAAYHRSSAETSTSYPASGTYSIDTLTKTFYDDYSWRPGEGNPLSASRNTAYDNYLQNSSNDIWPYPQDATLQTTGVKGMITGSKSKILGASSAYLYTVNFYDEMQRVVQVQSQNITAGTDILTTQYSWAGQALLTIAKNEKAGTNTETSLIVSHVTYDSLGRVTKVEKKISNSKVNQGSMPGSWKIIEQNEYDALGQLKKKKIGATPLDSLTYDYNIRGWMLGMNRSYVKDVTNTSNWFGFDLGYDKTGFSINGGNKSYTTAQYNGNIEGMLWKSTGDDQLRKYDFTYDGVNRLTGADFNQFTNNNFSKSAGIDFSVTGLDYDANGNILNMNQKGWKPGGSVTIDSLLYTYIPNSNRLLNVLDRKNDTATRLGDFRSSKAFMTALNNNKTTASTDYIYDANGNLTLDNNKDISLIVYNHLNLPDSIRIKGKGTIKYIYDAGGAKLKKITIDSTGPTVKRTTTLYLLGNYVNDTLQYLPTEEGRARIKDSNSIVYDYFIKDHLGNIRMVLTEQKDTAFYPPASMETAQASTEEALYENINITRKSKPTGYPTDNYTNPNSKVAWVGPSSGSAKVTGPAKVLKVMAGDKINIRVSSWWKSISVPGEPYNPLNDLLSMMSVGIGGITSAHGGPTINNLQKQNALNSALESFLNNQTYVSTKPKAYINWVLFDEQFNYVSTNSGFEQVGASDELKIHTHNNLSIDKSGYLYIYVSNVTPNIDVFFDNLQVTHIRGPLVSEDHYYPFGERAFGICSQALTFGDAATQKKKYNGIEKENDLSIEMYDAQLRDLDGQIGRWWQIDPKIESMEMWSPYASNYDNPITFSDPLGDEGTVCCKGIRNFFSGVLSGINKLGNSDAVVWINNNLNPLVAGAELISGKSLNSNFTEDKSRLEAGVHLATFFLPTAKVEAIIANEAKNVIVNQTGKQIAKTTEKELAKETVQRAMSKEELKATESSGLLRGGREGTHYVSDAVGSDAKRVRERLALPQTPEVVVTMKVPAGSISKATKVDPAFNMPGGGMERTATGNIPVEIIKVKKLPNTGH